MAHSEDAKLLDLQVTYWKTGDKASQTTDYIKVPDTANLVAAAREHVNSLNADLAGFQRPYVLLGTQVFVYPDPKEPKNHDWQPVSPTTLTDAAGPHHNVKCVKCGITGKHYEKALLATRDPRYLHSRFDSCAATIRYLTNPVNRIKERNNVRDGV